MTEEVLPQRLRVDRIGPQNLQRRFDRLQIALVQFLQIFYKLVDRDFADRSRNPVNTVHPTPPEPEYICMS